MCGGAEAAAVAIDDDAVAADEFTGCGAVAVGAGAGVVDTD